LSLIEIVLLRYDLSGRTSEVAFDGAEEMGWAAYFDALFTKVDKKMLDEDKKAYQGWFTLPWSHQYMDQLMDVEYACYSAFQVLRKRQTTLSKPMNRPKVI
jgi:hypothetical protein